MHGAQVFPFPTQFGQINGGGDKRITGLLDTRMEPHFFVCVFIVSQWFNTSWPGKTGIVSGGDYAAHHAAKAIGVGKDGQLFDDGRGEGVDALEFYESVS